MTRKQYCGLAGVCLLAVWAVFIPVAAKGESTTDPAEYEQEGPAAETTGAQYAAPRDLPVVLDNSGAPAGVSTGEREQPVPNNWRPFKKKGASANTTNTTNTPAAGPSAAGSGQGGDPGTGSWWPMTGRLIADQSGPTAQYLTSYIPGCLNGAYITSAWWTGCGANASYGGFTFGSGRTLGLRYTSKAGAGTNVRSFMLASADGGNVGQTLNVWLSLNPTASYAATQAACKSASTRNPYVITGPGYCPIVANKRYYLFISTNDPGTNFRYQVIEGSSDFY